jgi:ADP-heptose:LPS heptosyltransferase
VRVLLAKPCGLRGALALTPAVRSIRERHPAARITVLSSPAALAALEGCPGIDHALPLPLSPGLALVAHLRRQDFDHAFALAPAPAARRCVALSGAARRWVVGRPGLYLPLLDGWGDPPTQDLHEAARNHAVVAQAMSLPAAAPAYWFATSRMQEHGLLLEPGRYAVIHPTAADPARMLGAHFWSMVGRELVDSRAVDRLVVSCGADASERVYAEAVCGGIGPAASSLAGKLRIPQLARLLADARLCLGVDTPVLQLAAAVRCPVVGLYGPSDYGRNRPWDSLSRNVRVDNAPYLGETSAEWRDRMSRAFGRIRVDQVLQASDELLRMAG